MSIKKLYSNELLVSLEYSNIDKDYDFYYVTTSDKYIKIIISVNNRIFRSEEHTSELQSH